MQIMELTQLTGDELIASLEGVTFSGPRATVPGDVQLGELTELEGGQVFDAKNHLTPDQVQKTIIPHLLEVGQATLSYTEAIRWLRAEYGLTDNQPTSIVVSKIQQRRQQAVANEPLTVNQDELRGRLVAAFGPLRQTMGKGQEQFDRNVQALDTALRNDVLRDLRRCRTQGDFNRVLTDVRSLVGNFNYSNRRTPAPLPPGVEVAQVGGTAVAGAEFLSDDDPVDPANPEGDGSF